MKYPMVLGEYETLQLLQAGYSISRFGDGELKMMSGVGYVREPANKHMAKEMRGVLNNPNLMTLVGIPTMNINGPKYKNWERHYDRFCQVIKRKGPYYSAFISRPDSAPWIRNVEFAQMYQRLWLDRKVAVVCEKTGSALRAVRLGAKSVTHIVCPTTRAYRIIDLLEQAIHDAKPDIAILSCGPTATCLANRLSGRVQAIDFGSGGAFLAKLLKGEE